MNDIIQKIIPIPLSVRSNYKGYSDLLEIFDCYVKNEGEYQEIIIDFCENICFDSNMLPIIGAYVEYGAENYRIVSRYYNESTSKIHQLFLRNNFIKSCFGGSYKPLPNETAIPFQIFHSDEIRKFAMYTGTTIKETVACSMRRSMKRLPAHCIEWAVKPEHSLSTGLSKVYEFIYHNNGKFQIISGDEFLELNEQILRLEILDYSFPGTIINFEMDEGDTDYR